MSSAEAGARSSASQVLLLWAICALGPFARIWSYGEIWRLEALALAAVGLVLAIGLTVTCSRSWAALPAIGMVAVAAIAGMALNGRFVGAWFAIATLQAAAGGAGSFARFGVRPHQPQVRRALLLLSVVAAWFYRVRDLPTRLALVLLAAGFIAIAMGSIRHPAVQRASAAIERGASVLGRWIAIPFAAVVAVIGVLVPWVVHRVARWDPIGIGGRPTSGWVERSAELARARRMWIPEVARRPVFGASQLRLLAVSAAFAVLVAFVILRVPAPFGDQVDTPTTDPGAPGPVAGQNPVFERMVAEPWWEEFASASEEMWTAAWHSQFVGLEFGDFSGSDLTIEDGRRWTWAPDRSACSAPLRVWMFGGSTVFGIGNRDEHTLPSELAKAALADGVGLEISNYGHPGDVTWQQARRLERALRTESMAPDLVVFYGGGNDLYYSMGINGSDRLGSGDYIGPLDRLHMPLLTNLGLDPSGDEYVVRPRPPREERTLTDGEVADHALDQIEVALDLASLLATDAGVPIVSYVQPLAALRDPMPPDDAFSSPQERSIASAFHAAYEASASTQVDLTEVFDPIDGGHFNDAVHLDEEGNRIVADAMWADLRERIDALPATQDAACS